MRGVLALLLLGGCADPTLAVRLRVPEALSSVVARVRLRVMEPPAGTDLGCEAIARDQVPAAALEAIETTTVDLGDDGLVPIPPLDRLTPKRFVADGRTQDGRRAVAACAEVDDLEDTPRVVLEGEPVVSVRVLNTGPLFRAEAAGTATLGVALTDVTGRGLAGAGVALEVVAADDQLRTQSASADSSGNLLVGLPVPTRPGPFSALIAPRWSDGGPVRVPGFVAPTPVVVDLEAAAFGAAVARFGAGAVVAALVAIDGWRLDVFDAAAFGAGPLAVPRLSVRVGGSPSLAVVDAAGDGARVVVVSTPTSGVELLTLAPSGARAVYPLAPPEGASAARRVYDASGCGPTDPPRLAVLWDGGVLARYDLQGQAVDARRVPVGRGEYVASGCVSDDRGGRQRVWVATDLVGQLVIDVDGLGTTTWAASGLGLGFSDAIAGESLLLARQAQLEATVLARARLRLEGGRAAIEPLGVEPLPAPPVTSVGVDLDGDAALDTLALLARPSPARSRPDYAIWAALGRDRRGVHVEGSAPVRLPDLCNAVLVAGDFDADGVVDAIVAEAGPPILCGRLDRPRALLYRLGPR